MGKKANPPESGTSAGAVYGYVRVSSERQANEALSVEEQHPPHRRRMP